MGAKMTMITKYALLALLTTSVIALNNCGHRSDSTENALTEVKNGDASDNIILPGPPIGYPAPFVEYPVVPIEVQCGNGVDDDGDGLPDCADADCHVHPECSEWGPPLEELENGRSIVVHPNGLITNEDVVFLKARGNDDDDAHGWQRDNFFATSQKDCWVDPRYQDPYFNIPLGEALVAGPAGPVGPALFPNFAVAYWGPRAGLIDECEFGTELLFHHMDDDNGAGAGAAGDTDDDEGGDEDDDLP